MKILFVQKMAGISGSEIYFMNILPALVKLGHDCTFCCVEHPENSEKNKKFLKHLEENKVHCHILQSKWPVSPRLIWRLHQYIRKVKFDIVQTNLVHADFWGALIKKFLQPNMCLVSVKHGYDEGFQKRYGFDHQKLTQDTYYKLAKFSNQQMIQAASISEGLSELLVKGNLIEAGKLRTIHYGFDFSRIVVQKEVSSKFRFSNKQLIIVGRLIPVKQHNLVIELLPRIKEKIPDVKLVLVGTGEEEVNLRNLVSTLQLEEQVIFTGFQTNIHDYIYHSDIMLVPSSAEGFGVVILEGWHNAKPVIAFDVPAPNEIITDGKDGFLVKPFGTEELFERIMKLLESPERAAAMGGAGLEKLKQTFTMDIMIQKTLDMYDEALNFCKR